MGQGLKLKGTKDERQTGKTNHNGGNDRLKHGHLLGLAVESLNPLSRPGFMQIFPEKIMGATATTKK
jgi:hypothetical protein